MPRVQYQGPSHFRSITAAEFRGEGVNDVQKLEVARKDLKRNYQLNPNQLPVEVEVSQGVLDYLMEVEPGSWKQVQESESSLFAGPGEDPAGNPDA